MQIASQGTRFAASIGTGLVGACLLTSAVSAQTDLVVPAGTTLEYDTAQGPLVVSRLVIETGATLHASGLRPLQVLALAEVVIDGTLDVSGQAAPDVMQLGAPNVAKMPGLGGPAGGAGGIGSPNTTGSSAAGTAGQEGGFAPLIASGKGGNSGHSSSSASANWRGGGGGGGRLAADLAIAGSPFDRANWGLVALPGQAGANTATDAVLGTNPPQGGAAGNAVFVDADPSNDFFGMRLDPVTLTVQVGELTSPVGGSGGGAGGDSIQSAAFPALPWSLSKEKAGAGGGGGGGVAFVRTRRLTIGPLGQVLADGGAGARGESVVGLDAIGAGSGGGSGGMLLLQATQFDLSQAGANCLSARGGRGGPGAVNVYGAVTAAGGSGGPGLIQLHTFDPSTALQLAPGATLADLSVPDAKLLLPLP